MTIAVESIAVLPGWEAPLDPKPHTIVLQPDGNLDPTSSLEFRVQLEAAIEQVTDGVIVDFLWVNSTAPQGIAALVAGIQRAAMLGKAISFQSMDVQTRDAIEQEWNRQRQLSFGSWQDRFKDDLEQFLDQLAR
ncbi:STAS domain-containing protein [Pantanalinema rosaneae CENA516]|uniref:STAS domain-containing protein n=1 Tax=Pantanalinema rosaneae TaxID=1620701 RepID=UPI003D6FB653